jgi:SnoaL-like domain
MGRLAIVLLCLVGCASAPAPANRRKVADESAFRALMQQVADGWTEGNAQKAVDCFTDEALYEEPPRKQFHSGRTDLFEFFGGAKGADVAMHMDWHHLLFDVQTQVGAGEYTYRGRNQYHGVVVVQLRDGRIARWREYQTQSDLPWTEFVGATRF